MKTLNLTLTPSLKPLTFPSCLPPGDTAQTISKGLCLLNLFITWGIGCRGLTENLLVQISDSQILVDRVRRESQCEIDDGRVGGIEPTHLGVLDSGIT